jgi:N-acetylneuraminate synthase
MTRIVAEVALAHDGSLGAAHAYIDAVAAAGADAVKFQCHLAAEESTAREQFRTPAAWRQDASRYDYWRRTEFTAEQWAGLAEHAQERGLLFLCTPFSCAAVDLLNPLVRAWKIGSAEIDFTVMLGHVASTGKPVFLSCGLASYPAIDTALAWLRGCDVTLMHCVSEYPTPPEHVALNLMAELRERYSRPVGLSDHSGTIWPSLLAAYQGATIVEVHVTFSRECYGPDVPASLTIGELRQLVAGIRFVDQMRPVARETLLAAAAETRERFGRSLVAYRSLPAGHVLGCVDLHCKKPRGGLPPMRLQTLVGRRLQRALAADEPITEADLEP